MYAFHYVTSGGSDTSYVIISDAEFSHDTDHFW